MNKTYPVQNIILIGFMGTGKTTIGKILAEQLGWTFVDLDLLIEKDEERTIKVIFQESGEEYFRSKETKVLNKVLEQQFQILSTGGGIVLIEKNMEMMKKKGRVICLYSEPEEIYKRIKNNSMRPVLGVKPDLNKIKDILDYRKRFYTQAEWMIDTTNLTPKQAISKIREYLDI